MEETIGEQLIARCKAIDSDPGKVIYMLCWDDVLGIITETLCERGLTPDDLSNEEIETMFDKASDYLEGEGMPWRNVIALGIEDAWPTRLASGSLKPKDGTCENPDHSGLDQKS